MAVNLAATTRASTKLLKSLAGLLIFLMEIHVFYVMLFIGVLK